ncbi:hypothetical protein BDV19DRAFT_386668 [Aspergillus venezuelensis]
MAALIANTLGIGISVWSIADMFSGGDVPDPEKDIQVSLLIGDTPNSGGSVPHIALWDEDGNRFGQYDGDENGHLDGESTKTFKPIVPDSLINFFKPAPKYRADGGLKRPNQGIDRKTRAYPDGTNMHIHDTKRSHVRDWNTLSRNTTTIGNIRGLKNNNPDRLIISSREGHSARELCDHPNSLGPDFVDRFEGLFCDMDTGRVWPLCDDATTSGCFDMDTREFRAGGGGGDKGAKGAASTGSTPVKSYKSYKEW